ncbi:NAD(P)/FAD-dependent oxidoreductase [Oceanobacter mangrovi]|uniref:NAD(P)/FAD-dependent oxidoreductase n=1 Tax=Oceanobacter mangrovi TaxID=2862510 RepID=UPI001C8CFD48|nr:NAD(P)/FAD-dependent oxidoreductase [Oceanobacter mangrovi]
MTQLEQSADVIIIGAGPSGAVAGALLKQQGYQVTILEKQTFPRFSIGESLLPQCMALLEQANMLAAVEAEPAFQFKNGAAFHRNGADTFFDFREKFTEGWGTTYQVQRARFDQLLANAAAEQGVSIHYQHEIREVEHSAEQVVVHGVDAEGQPFSMSGRFLLDASGFGRVLPRLLELEAPSGFPVRNALFTHVIDRIDCANYDRNKILVTVHPQQPDVWFWLIPFANGTCSLGVVAKEEFFANYAGLEPKQRLQAIVAEDPNLSRLLANADYPNEVNQIHGYSANVKSLVGEGYALLGNAGEFLDPVFSSGVTIALKSAGMAADVLGRQLAGEPVGWEADYAEPLKRGVDTFRTYVEAWYDGRFQDVIFYDKGSDQIRRMISSILAGYAWDQANPFVKESERRLNTIVEIVRG